MKKELSCPVEATILVIGKRWKPLILWQLFQGVKRFSDLNRSIKGVTQKMLIQHLRELEADGVISRKVYNQVPPKVEYSLTNFGRTLKPLIDVMHRWGIDYLRKKKIKLEFPYE